jgi:hypothetical protein
MLQLRNLEIILQRSITIDISRPPAVQPGKETTHMRHMETVMGSMLTLATLALVVGTGITLA